MKVVSQLQRQLMQTAVDLGFCMATTKLMPPGVIRAQMPLLAHSRCKGCKSGSTLTCKHLCIAGAPGQPGIFLGSQLIPKLQWIHTCLETICP